ncbi:hypothetical protein IWW45_004567 [Coemansia sp. RSA 485]|nr:hypothetical protein IWW45_004567 [Coemansia sp. RSA 485]
MSQNNRVPAEDRPLARLLSHDAPTTTTTTTTTTTAAAAAAVAEPAETAASTGLPVLLPSIDGGLAEQSRLPQQNHSHGHAHAHAHALGDAQTPTESAGDAVRDRDRSESAKRMRNEYDLETQARISPQGSMTASAPNQHSSSMSVSVSPARKGSDGDDAAHRVYSGHRRTQSSEDEAARSDGGKGAEHDGGDAASDQRSDKESGQQAQKRRLNQACLLCRRKKIRCDSAHPSCANCQRRGIQCIYPEVRKRGRPPRMYTFADFALPGQPLPPELQGLANVHASAMLPAGGPEAQAKAQDQAAVSAPAYAGSDRSHGHNHGHGQSPALPPISVAVGRGVGAAAGAMLQPTPPLGVDQAVLDLFEYVAPSFPIIHRHTLVQKIRERSLSLPLWLAIHAVASRFEPHYGARHAPPLGPPGSGAGYAEKAHAMLVNRFGVRAPRSAGPRSERMPDTDATRRETIELLQAHVLLSIFYAGSGELDLAAEIHAAAVRSAQRAGVAMIDDPLRLQDFSGIFSPNAAAAQRRRAQAWLPPLGADANADAGTSSWAAPPPLPGGPNDVDMMDAGGAATSADLRRTWIEFETLRRLWWAMFVMDRMLHVAAGCPRMVAVGSFRVRLPCSDLEWDAMHAQPTTASPTAAGSAASSAPPAGLMVRTFREAVMHTSLSEQAANEISATPSSDPDVFRHAAALAGLFDCVIDLADDIRALAAPPLLEGSEILAQLRAEQLGSASPAAVQPAHARYGPTLRDPGHMAASAAAKQTATAIWLGSRRSSSSYPHASRAGWHSSSARSAWPPDWRTRMRVLQDRAAALEARFTEWYSSTPIARYARRPHLYSQLPLQDRITYFHHQIAYYGGVIQLHSLVVMAQGLLLPDPVDDASAIGPSALANMMWRSLLDMDPPAAVPTASATTSQADAIYAPRRRHYAIQPAWQPRRPYALPGAAEDDDAALVPLDEDGNSPEIVREELQRMVEAAWRRCTEAAIAMSAAVKRATEVRRVASANPNTSYYDPTFRPQVLPPYRGDPAPNGRATHAGTMAWHDRAPQAGEMRASPQQPYSAAIAAHRPGDRPPGPSAYPPYAPHQSPNHATFGESAAGPGQVVDDATFFMRFNMFTCSAAYAGAFIHLQNLRLAPQWALAVQRHSDAVAKSNELRALHDSGATALADDRDLGLLSDPHDIGALPPQLPPPLPLPPCSADQARDGVKPLVRILDGISPYWRVTSHVAKLRALWRDIEGAELSLAPAAVPDQRLWSTHAPPLSPPYPHASAPARSLHHAHRRHAPQSSAAAPPLHPSTGMPAPPIMGNQLQPLHPHLHPHSAHPAAASHHPLHHQQHQQQQQQQMGMPHPPPSRP